MTKFKTKIDRHFIKIKQESELIWISYVKIKKQFVNIRTKELRAKLDIPKYDL